MNDIVKLAVDAYKGTVEKYSVQESQETLRQALIEANGGSSVLDYKKIRDGECNGLFSIIEEILSSTIVDSIQDDPFFQNLVEFRNVALGDSNVFVVDGGTLFVVAEAADGTQGIRRQRLGNDVEAPVPTTMKIVRIYEELNRVLSGRVAFNAMIDRVALSFKRKLLDDVYTLWAGATADQLGGVTYYPTAGTYDEDALLDLIAHVEAAADGKPATIICTKKAARTLKPSIIGEAAMDDLYHMGYYGSFYGTPVIVVPNRHKVGTTEFLMSDNEITIIAGDEKPIKCVYEGDPIVLLGDPMTNADFTQELTYAYAA